MKLIEELNGTQEAEILKQMEDAYENIKNKQNEWYEKSQFFCPDACGECCRNFEPDLLECEVLYMAAWLLENNHMVAMEILNGIFPFENNKGCLFWDENNPYHCSIYGGRPFVCRMFGACSSRAKNGETVFKPCKFYPVEKLAEYKVPLMHKQYSQEETLKIFGCLPPVMSDLMESAVAINPDNHETKLIHEILPDAIKRILWIKSLC